MKTFGEIRKSVEVTSETTTPATKLLGNILSSEDPLMSRIHSAQQQQQLSTQAVLQGSAISRSATSNLLLKDDEDDRYPDPSSHDTIVVLLTLSLISITIYFSYYWWRKHRHRILCASKLEDYRYSRLSQNEIDVDNIEFNNPLQPADDCIFETETGGGADGAEHSDIDDKHFTGPATLNIETDTANMKGGGENNECNLLIDDLSDEDLLQ